MKLNHQILAVTALGLTWVSTGCVKSADQMGDLLLKSENRAGLSIPPGDDRPIVPPGGGDSPPPVDTTPPNARVFYKSPVFVAQNSVGYTVSQSGGQLTTTPKDVINLDAYLSDVAVTDTVNGYLENADIKIHPDPGKTKVRARANGQGQWLFSSLDTKDHQLGQLMAYYWIQTEKKKAEQVLPKSWHPTGKNITVYTFCKSMFNAYWDISNNLVCMGYVNNFEAAYDASVYLHEMGHANIDYATQQQIYSQMSDIKCSQGQCCPSAAGCIGAINEGQADVHSYIVFNSGRLAEFFMNNKAGFRERDGELQSSTTLLKAQDRYAQSAEIHGMGGVWGTAWWNLRKRIGATAADKIFFAHLELLQGRDTFRTALNLILKAAETLKKGGKLDSAFRDEILASFADHGISPG